MMYTFPKRLKVFSLACMIIGLLGLTYGFLSAPSTIEEAIEMSSSDHYGESENHSSGEHLSNQDHENHLSHEEHLLHKLQNKPWAALYVSAFFFMMISLGVLAFYAIQRAAQAGWSIVLYRVMEGITAYLLPGGIIVIAILILSPKDNLSLFAKTYPIITSSEFFEYIRPFTILLFMKIFSLLFDRS